MNKLLKIVSSIVIFALLFGNISFAIEVRDSNYNSFIKEIIMTKHNLEKTRNGKSYVKQIDKFIDSLEKKQDLDTLKKLESKIQNLLTFSSKNKISKNNILLLKYIHAKVIFSIYNLKNAFINLDSTFENKLSSEEKKKVEDEIIKLQLNMIDSASNIFKAILDNFKKLSSYEDNGNLHSSLKIDYKGIGNLDYNLELKDYSVKNSNFNSQLTTKLNTKVNGSFGNDSSVDLSIESFIDFISKDGNTYLLLDKLNIKDESSEEIKRQIKVFSDSLEKIAKSNKYIKFEDRETKEALEYIKSLNPSRIISNSRAIASKPLLEPYKKDGEKFLLKPTKYACDKAKEIMGKFDPFYANDRCSESQYEDMLKSLAETGELYIILGKENKIGFISENSIEKAELYISYNDKSILALFIEITPNQDRYPKEGFKLTYKTQNELNFYFNIDNSSTEYSFESKLDKKNNFTYIKFNGHSASKYDDFSINLELKNRIITGEYEFNSFDYDWSSKQSKKVFNIKGNISGATDINNSLSSFVINSTGLDLQKNSKTFELDFSLKNTKIDGLLKIFDNKELLMTIKSTGKYDKNYLKLDNSIVFSGKATEAFVSGFNSQTKEESKLSTEVKNIISNLNFLIDNRNNNKNLNIYADLNIDTNKIIEFKLDNKATRTYKTIEIKTPSNTTGLEEVFPKQENIYY